MALFNRNRNYDRDYGRQGMRGGYDRDMGARSRERWDYLDTESDERSIRGYDHQQFRGERPRWSTSAGLPGGNRGGNAGMRYDRDMGRGNRDFQNTGSMYDREFQGGYGADAGYGYDRGYKSRQETDYGDPFGDRQNRTPIRMTRGEYQGGGSRGGASRGGYDTGYRGGNRENRNPRYERDYSANPMSYDPYSGGGYGRNY